MDTTQQSAQLTEGATSSKKKANDKDKDKDKDGMCVCAFVNVFFL